MVTTGELVRQIAALHDAIDRLTSCRSNAFERELVAVAAQDVLRAWVQTRRRTQELERAIAVVVSGALDRAALDVASARHLDGSLGLTGWISPRSGERDPLLDHRGCERYSTEEPVSGSADNLASIATTDPVGRRAAR